MSNSGKKINWQGVFGHQKVKKMLQGYIDKGKLPHSMIFLGPAGIGKKSIFERLAKAVLCQKVDAPCNNCVFCRQYDLGNDFVWRFDGNKKVSIDDIRKMKSNLSMTQFGGKERFVLIDNADILSKEIFNACLKLIEEPGNKIYFIFISKGMNRILPTIASRSVLVRFDLLVDTEINQYIQANNLVEHNVFLLNIAMGKPAITNNLGLTKHERNQKNVIFFWSLLKGGITNKYLFVQKIFKADEEALRGLLFFWESCFRDYFLWLNGVNERVWWNYADLMEFYKSLSINRQDLLVKMDNFSILKKNLKTNASKRNLLLDFLIENN